MAGNLLAWQSRAGILVAPVLALALCSAPQPQSRQPAAVWPDLGAKPFTISAWVSTRSGGAILARCPAEGPWAPQAKALFVREGKLCFDVGWVGVVTSQADVADGRPHHIALTGPNPYTLWVDGRRDAQAALAGEPDPPGALLRVGAACPNFPEPAALDGEIADLRLIRRALGASEIASLAARPPTSGDAVIADRLQWIAGDGGAAIRPLRLRFAGRRGLDLPGSAVALPSPDTAASVAALRRAITTLQSEAGASYPSRALLARLAPLEAAARRDPSSPRLAAALDALRREALVTRNPLLGFRKVLVVKRKTYQSSHYYTDYIDGCRDYGGSLAEVDLVTGRSRDLAPGLARGIFGRFDLSFDATRVAFDWKASPEEGFRIWEVGVDGKGLRQLTFPEPTEAELVRAYRNVGTPTGIPYRTGTDDMHPCYLPCGDIVFISTRCRKGILCDEPDVLTTTVLYRMDRNGKQMRPLSYNSVSEATPTVTADGRILYTRWEYVDKGGSACKCLWSMNPDGSGSAEVYANSISHPTTFIDARDIPGHPGLYLATGAPHMPLCVGAILELNTVYPLTTQTPLTYRTPEIRTPDEHGYRHLRNGVWTLDYSGPLYREPYPLSRSFCLAAGNPDRPYNQPNAYAVTLMDAFGNRVEVYRDPATSCWEPFPLRPRRKPPVIPDRSGPDAWGSLVLSDVYEGMQGIARGRVKFLRIMEDVPRPWSARRTWPGDGRKQQHVVVSKDGHLAPKIVHGIVDVAADGSAAFRVPANRNLFLQALDANHMELQRMRTFVNVRPGETRGCVGCHEEKKRTPIWGAMAAALRRPFQSPRAEDGQITPRTVHYATDVQPILDRRCVGCHGSKAPAAGLDLTGAETEQFCRSYEALIDRKLAGNVVDEIGAKHGNIEATPPLTYGSHTSKLAKLLLAGHGGTGLTQAERIRMLTWIDANAPYYGSYDGRRNIRYAGMPDYRPKPPEGPSCTAWSGPPGP